MPGLDEEAQTCLLFVDGLRTSRRGAGCLGADAFRLVEKGISCYFPGHRA